MTAPSPAMDDSPTVPRPPGAVEAVLAAHEGTYLTDDHVRCACGAAKPSGWGLSPDQHRAHVAQALVDAGCVLGDDTDWPRLTGRVCTDPNCTIPRKPGFPMHGPHDFVAGTRPPAPKEE